MSGIAAFFQAVRGKWHHHLRPAVHQRNLTSFGSAPIARSARDDLRTNAYQPRGGSAGSELRINRMMQAFRIDRRELEQDYPKVLQDAELTCARCRLKRECYRELEAGTAAANADHFCPNSDLFMIFANDRDDSLSIGPEVRKA